MERLGPGRVFAHKVETGRVIPFETRPMGGTSQLNSSTDDANSKLQDVMDIIMTDKRLEQTEFEHMRGLRHAIKQILTVRKDVVFFQFFFGWQAQTCKIKGTIVGTVDLDERRRDNDGQSW